MLAVQNFAFLGQSIKIYCIAEKIHGIQFRGWSMFTIFVDMGTHTHMYMYHTIKLISQIQISRLGDHPWKLWKLGPSKISRYTVVIKIWPHLFRALTTPSLVNQTPAFCSGGCTALSNCSRHMTIVELTAMKHIRGGARYMYVCAHCACTYWISCMLVVFNAFCLVIMPCHCIPVCHGRAARIPRPSIRVLVT